MEKIIQLLTSNGYKASVVEDLPRVWKMAVKESQPENTALYVTKLRDVRIS